MKFSLILSLFFSFVHGADTLMDALLQGNFEKKILLNSNTDDEQSSDLSKQKIMFHYLSAPIKGIQVEVKNDGLIGYVKALYTGSIADFNYIVSANSDSVHASSYTMDVLYNVKRNVALGSRYTIKNENAEYTSYSGVYTSLSLNEINKGLHIGLEYDKIGVAQEGNKLNLTIKNNF